MLKTAFFFEDLQKFLVKMSQLTPAEAPQLVELIQNTVHSEENKRTNALKTVEEWERIPGYCSLLQVIFVITQ